MKRIEENWVDENNNSWPCRLYSEEEAKQKSKTLLDCSDCSGCSDCSRCSDCSGCSGCSDCSGCSGCSDCSRCSDCSGYKENPMRYVSSKIGSRDSQTTVYWTEKEDVQVVCGCFRGDLDQFEAKVKETHKESSEHRTRYLALISLVRTIIDAKY